MGYSRQDQARTLYLLRAAYTNFGEPNYTYIFQTNGPGMSVALKAKTNYVSGDTLQFHHGLMTFLWVRDLWVQLVVSIIGLFIL